MNLIKINETEISEKLLIYIRILYDDTLQVFSKGNGKLDPVKLDDKILDLIQAIILSLPA